MWYGSRAIDEYSVTNKKSRSQIKNRYVICLAIDACLTINTQNKKCLSCDKPFYIFVIKLAGLELLIFIIISIIYVFFVHLESSQHSYMSQMLDTVLHFQHIHP
jgi:hypothetical protein